MAANKATQGGKDSAAMGKKRAGGKPNADDAPGVAGAGLLLATGNNPTPSPGRTLEGRAVSSHADRGLGADSVRSGKGCQPRAHHPLRLSHAKARLQIGCVVKRGPSCCYRGLGGSPPEYVVSCSTLTMTDAFTRTNTSRSSPWTDGKPNNRVDK